MVVAKNWNDCSKSLTVHCTDFGNLAIFGGKKKGDWSLFVEVKCKGQVTAVTYVFFSPFIPVKKPRERERELKGGTIHKPQATVQDQEIVRE